MKVLVVYESHFGQTKAIAEAVEEGIGESGSRVSLVPVAEADAEAVRRAHLLVVGGPTHVRGMSRPWSRRKAAELATGDDDGELPAGVREWLESLPPAEDDRLAAAFDTRIAAPGAGGAAPGIARRLRRTGFTVVEHPEGFVLEGSRGPLRNGELERARAWGARLVGVATGRAV